MKIRKLKKLIGKKNIIITKKGEVFVTEDSINLGLIIYDADTLELI